MISLYARGLTTGEICAHVVEVYGASVSKDTVSRITDRVIEDMAAWSLDGHALAAGPTSTATQPPAESPRGSWAKSSRSGLRWAVPVPGRISKPISKCTSSPASC